MLLRLKAVHIHRQLCRSHNVRKINKFPAGKLGPVAEIEVLTQRVILPAPALLDTGAPPEAGRSIEIEKPAATAARSLLKQKMSIQKNRLHASEQRITAIQMSPAGLDHSHFRVSEVMDGSLQQILLRDKIGVKDTNKLAFRILQSDCQSSSFETCTVDPMNTLNIKTALLQFCCARGGDIPSFIC